MGPRRTQQKQDADDLRFMGRTGHDEILTKEEAYTFAENTEQQLETVLASDCQIAPL
jgi:hypothetical protein